MLHGYRAVKQELVHSFIFVYKCSRGHHRQQEAQLANMDREHRMQVITGPCTLLCCLQLPALPQADTHDLIT